MNRIEWKEKLCRSHKSFSFLLERFKQFYLPHIFPSWSNQTNLYPPSLGKPIHKNVKYKYSWLGLLKENKMKLLLYFYLDLPQLRRSSGSIGDPESRDPILSCRVVVIKWVASFTHVVKRDVINMSHSTR